MKQIRRAEMENERMENRDNHNTKDDNHAKNFTAQAKGSKARADNPTTGTKGSKARADDLTTEAKGGKARAEENSSKSEGATRDDTIEITTKTTAMVTEQGEEFPFTMRREIPCNEVKMIIGQRTETGIQTSETGHEMGEQWEGHWRNTNWRKRFDYWRTKDPYELENKKKSTLVQDRRCQNDQRRRHEH